MSLSDVVAHTSVVPEPFGRVIVESMLARTPVVATRAGGAVEIVEDEVNGILVSPGDAEALAKVIYDLLTDPHKANALVEAGHATAMERFSRQTMLDGVAQQLQEVAAWR
jgi:glycosyltransferase involved in cell wall biosynthesis